MIWCCSRIMVNKQITYYGKIIGKTYGKTFF